MCMAQTVTTPNKGAEIARGQGEITSNSQEGPLKLSGRQLQRGTVDT